MLISKNRELLDQNSILANSKEVLDKRYRTVEGEIKYALESMKSAVEKVRNNSMRTALGDITLANGKLLRGAVVRKVDITGVSLIHSDGIGTVQADLLPKDVLERFDLGVVALLPQLEYAQAALLDQSAPEPVDDAGVSKIVTLNKRIAVLEIRIEGAAKHVEKLEKEVKDIEKEIAAADKKRATTQTLRTMKDVAEGNAGMARNELKVQRLELEKMKLELESLQRKK